MNFQKIYEQAKLDEALNLKKALAVGLMGLGLATSAFAKNSSGTFSKNGKSASYEGKDGCAVSMVTTRNRSQGGSGTIYNILCDVTDNGTKENPKFYIGDSSNGNKFIGSFYAKDNINLIKFGMADVDIQDFTTSCNAAWKGALESLD